MVLNNKQAKQGYTKMKVITKWAICEIGGRPIKMKKMVGNMSFETKEVLTVGKIISMCWEYVTKGTTPSMADIVRRGTMAIEAASKDEVEYDEPTIMQLKELMEKIVADQGLKPTEAMQVMHALDGKIEPLIAPIDEL